MDAARVGGSFSLWLVAMLGGVPALTVVPVVAVPVLLGSAVMLWVPVLLGRRPAVG